MWTWFLCIPALLTVCLGKWRPAVTPVPPRYPVPVLEGNFAKHWQTKHFFFNISFMFQDSSSVTSPGKSSLHSLLHMFWSLLVLQIAYGPCRFSFHFPKLNNSVFIGLMGDTLLSYLDYLIVLKFSLWTFTKTQKSFHSRTGCRT